MKKIIIGIVVLLLFLIAAAIAIPFLYKDQIVAKAKEEINKTLNAKVNFGEFDLTLISSFPKLKFTINDFVITGVDDFEGDTLTAIQSLEIKLNIWDVIGGSKMKINSIALNNAYINILVLKDGKANYDITKPSPSGTSSAETSSFQLALQSYSLNNSRISYDDRSLDFKMTLNNLNHNGKGDFTADVSDLITNTTADKTNLWYGGVKYLSNVKTKLEASFTMDLKNSKYTFKENELALNDLLLGFDGWLAMPKDDIDMDLKWNVKKTDFKNFISLIPGVYSSSFNDVKSSGKLALNGFVKGTYNDKKIPGFALNLKIDKGMFQYPSLPTAVNNVNVDLALDNKDGKPDNTIINLKTMHVELGAEPFDARLYVATPVSDANIDAMLKGTINLANMNKIVPMENGTNLNGIIKSDITMKGRYSSIEKKEYEKFNANGTFSLTGMNYKSTDYPLTVVNNMLLSFNPKNVSLTDLNIKVGKSDIKASGSIDNLLGYYFKNELLKGSFMFNSSLLDVNEFMTGNATTSATSTSTPTASTLSVIEVPSNIDFTLNSSIAKILYDNLMIENLNGSIALRSAKIEMQNLFFKMLNGTVKMSGFYSAPKPSSADIDYNLSVSGFDIQQTFKTFTTVQKMVPIAERASGKFSTDFSITGKLDEHMLNSLNGKGKLMSENLVINNFEPLNKIADALQMDEYKSMPLENLNISFKVKDGRVYVDPFETNMKGSKALIQGSNGFDQTIDYKLKLVIPKNKMSAKAIAALGGMFAKANNIAGTNLQLPDPLNVNVLVGGNILKPTIKTDLANQGKNVVENVKEQIKDKVEAQVDNAKAKAREQADKIIADAQAQAQKIRDAAKLASDNARKQGYAAADKVVAEAKNPIAKVTAQETAKKMKSETDKKCQKIIDEGNNQAFGVIEAAKKKSDELLK
jgi:hypothetical protein